MNTFGKSLMAVTLGTGAMSIQAMEFRFDNPEELKGWVIVNDGVMGGKSQSDISIENSALIFSGHVSLENNGGFASTRRVGFKTPKGSDLVRILVKGDGKTYQLRLKDNNSWNGATYTTSFNTEKGSWVERTFGEKDFVAKWRGQTIPDAPPLVLSQVTQLGFLISDKQEGKFEVQIKEIEFMTPGE